MRAHVAQNVQYMSGTWKAGIITAVHGDSVVDIVEFTPDGAVVAHLNVPYGADGHAGSCRAVLPY